MSKYQPLSAILARRGEPYWRVAFSDLEEVLGFPLPKTAHESAAWWANSAEKAHNRAWLDAGWHVESVDRAGQAVLFHRDGYAPEEDLPDVYFSLPDRQSDGEIKRIVSKTAMVGGVIAVAAGVGAVAFNLLRRRQRT